jgi:peptidyl-prolyl cis-trans isomerase D
VEPAQVKLDYVELKKEPSEMDFADMEAFAKTKIELAKGDADFAELAQKYSDDPAGKANGGDLGFFKKGNPRTKDIEKAAFSMKPGEISDVIRTADGFHIIKVEETKGSGDKKEVRARDIFFKVNPSDDTTLSLEERASSLSYKAQESSLKEAAKAANVEVKSTPLFVETSPVIPLIGRITEVSKIIPGLENGAVSSVIETAKASYIVQVVERKPARIPELSEVKTEVESAAKAQKALELAKAKAGELVKQVNDQGKQLKDIAKAREALPFTRRGYPPELPRVEGLVDTVFSLKDGMAAGPFADSKVACVVQLQKKIEPDEAGYEVQKKGIEQRMLAQRKQELFKEYYENLKEKAGVKINQALLDTV